MISELPYCMALEFFQLDMLFTLLLCFFILCVIYGIENKILKAFLLIILGFVSVFFDWGLLAPIFTMLFAWSRNDRSRTVLSYGLAALLFAGFNYMSYAMYYPAHLCLLLTIKMIIIPI